MTMSMYERSESNAGEIAMESIAQNIGAGAGICANFGGAVWERVAYIDQQTGETGVVHQILSGKPGTNWHRFYTTLIGISSHK